MERHAAAVESLDRAQLKYRTENQLDVKFHPNERLDSFAAF
jgi:hypothetical protein